MNSRILILCGCVAILSSGCSELDPVLGSHSAMHEGFAVATAYNLSQTVNKTERLTEPADLGEVNSQAAVGPIERYQTGQVREMDLELGSVGSSSK